MNIAITGVTGFRNRGVEALVQPILAGLERRYPGCEVTLYSGSPEYDRIRLPQNTVRVLPEGKSQFRQNRLEKALNRLGGARGRMVHHGWGELERSQLLIVTGGDVFSSEYGDWSFERHLLPMRVAMERGVPFVIFAQSIGPFTSDKHRASFVELARHASGISVREMRTLSYLTGQLGIDAGVVTRVADPAFLLEPNKNASAYADRSLRGKGPLVAVALSQGIADWTQLDSETRYRTWSAVLQRIVESWSADVLLVPHVQEPYGNDTIACTEVWRKLDFHPAVRVLGGDFSASEYKGIISRCDLVIAERMHAGIAGLSSRVCTSIVAYSAKSRGIMDRMVGPENALRGALIEGAEFNSVDKVWAKLEWTWRNREAICRRLAETVAEEQVEALRAFAVLP